MFGSARRAWFFVGLLSLASLACSGPARSTDGESTRGAGGAASGSGDGSSTGVAGGTSSTGSGGNDGGPRDPDPCTAAGTCPPNTWVDVTPEDIVIPDSGLRSVVLDPLRPTDLYSASGEAG